MSALLAFDIGGTQIKYGIVSDIGEVLHAEVQNTCAADGGPALVDRLLALAPPLIAQYQPIGIAISSLGLIEPIRGTVLGAAEAVPDYPGIALIPAFENAFGLPVTAENDVNCVALAEGWTGAAQGVQDYLAIAIGTGIGGGIVLGGRLHRGHRAAAGEWGYMNIGGQIWESQASQRGFAHLEQHNLEYLDDGVENIIDDYCALLAACELLAVSGDGIYADAAARRVLNLLERQTAEGWFTADAAGDRSYFHAAEAGLPYIALMRFVEIVPSSPLVGRVREVLRCAFEYEFKITFASVNNPFGYPRQFVKQSGKAGREQFFIPHDNGTGYWWQGENARLGSIAAASSRAQTLFANEPPLVTKLEKYEQAALDWLLGANPFDACMLQGWGRNNPRYEVGFYNAPGGVCNGITSGLNDENDIDFKKSEIATMANSWRWTEQWMPHGAWLFLALSTRIGKNQLGWGSALSCPCFNSNDLKGK
ncbi:MAG: ROK family protein [Burkholderiales bacterium]|nr:ROK family protein [Burkholderiales bacterium]